MPKRNKWQYREFLDPYWSISVQWCEWFWYLSRANNTVRQRHMGCCNNMFRLKRYILKTRKAKIGKKNLILKKKKWRNEFWAEQNIRAGAKQMGPCRASDDRGDDLGGKRGPNHQQITSYTWSGAGTKTLVYIYYTSICHVVIIMYVIHHIYCIFLIYHMYYIKFTKWNWKPPTSFVAGGDQTTNRSHHERSYHMYHVCTT